MMTYIATLQNSQHLCQSTMIHDLSSVVCKDYFKMFSRDTNHLNWPVTETSWFSEIT